MDARGARLNFLLTTPDGEQIRFQSILRVACPVARESFLQPSA